MTGYIFIHLENIFTGQAKRHKFYYVYPKKISTKSIYNIYQYFNFNIKYD